MEENTKDRKKMWWSNFESAALMHLGELFVQELKLQEKVFSHRNDWWFKTVDKETSGIY